MIAKEPIASLKDPNSRYLEVMQWKKILKLIYVCRNNVPHIKPVENNPPGLKNSYMKENHVIKCLMIFTCKIQTNATFQVSSL